MSGFDRKVRRNQQKALYGQFRREWTLNEERLEREHDVAELKRTAVPATPMIPDDTPTQGHLHTHSYPTVLVVPYKRRSVPTFSQWIAVGKEMDRKTKEALETRAREELEKISTEWEEDEVPSQSPQIPFVPLETK